MYIYIYIYIYGFSVTYLPAPGDHGAEFKGPVSVIIIIIIIIIIIMHTQRVGKKSSIMIYHTSCCKTLNPP